MIRQIYTYEHMHTYKYHIECRCIPTYYVCSCMYVCISLCAYLACLEVAEKYLYERANGRERERERGRGGGERAESAPYLTRRSLQPNAKIQKQVNAGADQTSAFLAPSRSFNNLKKYKEKTGATGKTSSKFNARTFGDS